MRHLHKAMESEAKMHMVFSKFAKEEGDHYSLLTWAGVDQIYCVFATQSDYKRKLS